MRFLFSGLILALSVVFGQGAAAQQLVASYVAVIGYDDLFNSRGQRLTTPAQILRQDRANFHRFGIRHQGDTSDPFFANIDNRAAMERMVRAGYIDPRATSAIVNGYAQRVIIEIYGVGNRGDYVQVTVLE